MGIKPASAKENNQPSIQPKGTLPPNLPPIEKEPTLIDTGVKSILLLMAQAVSVPILEALKIPVGKALNVMDEETIRRILEWPLYKIILAGGVVAPVLEEAFFRGLPNLIVKGHPKESLWEIGIPVSAVFALAHNVTKDEDTGKNVFATDTIPLHQFISGLFFWKMMRERGFPHAVAAHGTMNSVALTVGKLLYEASKG